MTKFNPFYSVTDLHLILAMVELNGRSNRRQYKAISLVYEVLSALEGDREIQNFLPIFTEVIIWGATDEGVDDLIEKCMTATKCEDHDSRRYSVKRASFRYSNTIDGNY